MPVQWLRAHSTSFGALGCCCPPGGLGARRGCRRSGPERALQNRDEREWRDEDRGGVVRRDDIVNAPHEPLVSSGTLAPPAVEDRVRYTQPDERRPHDGDMMTMSWPSRHLSGHRRFPKRIQRVLADSSPDELRSHFTIAAREAEDRPGTYLVTMVPKRKQILGCRLDLWVIERRSCWWHEDVLSGDTKLMTFTDVKPNALIDPSVFSVEPR